MSDAGSRYDTIGRSYAKTRRQDPLIAEQVHAALGEGSLVNIGAGSGNYEPPDRTVVAVEPSLEMIRQRPDGSAPAVRFGGSVVHVPPADVVELGPGEGAVAAGVGAAGPDGGEVAALGFAGES